MGLAYVLCTGQEESMCAMLPVSYYLLKAIMSLSSSHVVIITLMFYDYRYALSIKTKEAHFLFKVRIFYFKFLSLLTLCSLKL